MIVFASFVYFFIVKTISVEKMIMKLRNYKFMKIKMNIIRLLINNPRCCSSDVVLQKAYITYIYHIEDFMVKGKQKSIFNDPDIPKQWYLLKPENSRNFLSHDIHYSWSLNITGKGVIVGLINGGVDVKHRDLKNNFSPALSFNFAENSKNISKSIFGRATECAGIISAVANNGICGSGIAPSSKFAVLQVFNDDYTIIDSKIIARAFTYSNQKIDIYVMDWGYNFNNHNYINRDSIISRSLRYAFNNGRRRTGSIILISSGQYKSFGSDCSFKEYHQRGEIFVFGAISVSGEIPDYTEGCTAILAASLSSKTLTKKELMYSTTWGNLCEKSIGGMAACSSMAAGIIALLLGDNPKLTPRQVMILIIKTSIQIDPYAVKNAAGYYYSNRLGFGLINAKYLIKGSRNESIMSIKRSNICKTYLFSISDYTEINRNTIFYFYTSACLNSSICITNIEQIFISFTFFTPVSNYIRMHLTSPSGTRLQIIEPRHLGYSKTGFFSWRLKVMGYFDERPIGVWKLEVFSQRYLNLIRKFQLFFYGTCINAQNNLKSHLNVRTMILENIENISLPIYQKILTFTDLDNNIDREHLDLLSFSHEEFHLMSLINNLL